jgi:hypothetical protein
MFANSCPDGTGTAFVNQPKLNNALRFIRFME